MPRDENTNPPIPVSSEIHPELRQFCADMRSDMQEVKTALVGNKYQKGLIPQVDAIQTRVDGHDRKLYTASAILGAGGSALVLLKDYLFK